MRESSGCWHARRSASDTTESGERFQFLTTLHAKVFVLLLRVLMVRRSCLNYSKYSVTIVTMDGRHEDATAPFAKSHYMMLGRFMLLLLPQREHFTTF